MSAAAHRVAPDRVAIDSVRGEHLRTLRQHRPCDRNSTLDSRLVHGHLPATPHVASVLSRAGARAPASWRVHPRAGACTRELARALAGGPREGARPIAWTKRRSRPLIEIGDALAAQSWTTAPPPPRRAAGVGLVIAIHMSLGITRDHSSITKCVKVDGGAGNDVGRSRKSAPPSSAR